jgi:hypothetical protein
VDPPLLYSIQWLCVRILLEFGLSTRRVMLLGRDDGGCLLIEGIRKPLKATARRADDAPSSTPYQCGTRQMPGYGSRVAAHTATLQPQEVPKSAITPLLPHVGYRWGMRGLAPWQPVPSIPRDKVSPNLQLECNRKLAISCAFVGKSRQLPIRWGKAETRLLAQRTGIARSIQARRAPERPVSESATRALTGR